MRRFGPIIVVTTLLTGCAESQLGGSLLYMTPYQVDRLECSELKNRAAAAATRVKQMEELRDKANQSAAGPVINAMVYGPDYSRARWDQQLYDGEIARKNCNAPPPPPPEQPAK